MKTKNSVILKVGIILCITAMLSSCHKYERIKDEVNYKAISKRKANVKVPFACNVVEFKNVTIVYSETNATTLLISDSIGRETYIQGPAIVEFLTER